MINESDEETEAMLQPEEPQNSGGALSQNGRRKQHPPALVNLGQDDDSDWGEISVPYDRPDMNDIEIESIPFIKIGKQNWDTRKCIPCSPLTKKSKSC